MLMHANSQSVWLALYLPRLATDRLIRARAAPEAALAVYAKQKNAYVLSGVDARAAALGLHVGQALADARAIHPALHTFEAEPAEDARVLDAIAAWCERFTPIVVIDAPDGLFLDISGCGHLFGGDDVLRDTLVVRLTGQGFTCRAALAATPGAAWALARYGGEELAPLPIEALRLDSDAAALLRRLGLKTIGQLIEAPRAAFAARAGQRAMLRLDQALGRAPEALSPRRPAPPVFASRRFLEPLFAVETILVATQDLCADIVERLDRRGAGARACALHLFGVDGRDRVIEIGVSQPERDGRKLLRLFREKLNRVAETLDTEFGIEAARLDVVRLARMDSAPRALVDHDADRSDAIAALIDVLSARLGSQCVLIGALLDVHQPERAGTWGAALDATSPVNGGGVANAPRPLSLFSSPQPIDAIATVPDGPPIRFRWRRVLREVVRAEGPERIAGDWLRGGATRDFYRVEDKEGRRYWLCREGFYGEDDAPRWFVAGLLA
jgi:protein ImuB